MNKFIALTDGQWEDQFKPVDNIIEPDNDQRFETYGKELDYVRLMESERRVWTCVEGEDDKLITVNGMAFVNRLYYYVCDVPYEPDTDYEVTDPDYPWEG